MKLFPDGGNFPLSDGSALLMRLQLEGVDIGDRAREQAAKWESHNEDFVSLSVSVSLAQPILPDPPTLG